MRVRRAHRRAATLGSAVVVTIVLLGSMLLHAGSTGHDTTAGLGSNLPTVNVSTPLHVTTSAITMPAVMTSASMASPSKSRDRDESSLAALLSEAGEGTASVSAVNIATGKHVTAGASRGMLEASVSKIALLEILLLERQEDGKLLTDNEDHQLVAMIEHSSNAAADAVFELAGGHDTVVAHQKPLGLDTAITIYGPGNLWGLTTTSAAQQVILLGDLVDDDSPLNAASRAYAMNLLENVEDDQQWGVPSAADPGTSYAVKNGWLAVDDDHDLWAVNSDGIITVDGQRLLVSVMTQHNTSFDGGIAFNEKLVKAVVAAVT